MKINYKYQRTTELLNLVHAARIIYANILLTDRTKKSLVINKKCSTKQLYSGKYPKNINEEEKNRYLESLNIQIEEIKKQLIRR